MVARGPPAAGRAGRNRWRKTRQQAPIRQSPSSTIIRRGWPTGQSGAQSGHSTAAAPSNPRSCGRALDYRTTVRLPPARRRVRRGGARSAAVALGCPRKLPARLPSAPLRSLAICSYLPTSFRVALKSADSCPRVVRRHLLEIRKHGIIQMERPADSCPPSHGHRVRPHGRESSDSPCGGRTLSAYTVSACPPVRFQVLAGQACGQLSAPQAETGRTW